jgi:transcriptional regulator with XRE-family HTH domain
MMASAMVYEGDTASTGVTPLDSALGGLYWGDNVVWEPDEHDSVEPFFRAVATHASEYHYAGYVSLSRDPAVVRAAFPGLAVIDARPGTPLAEPGKLLEEIRHVCSTHERDLLLFDPLETMAAQWDQPTAQRFFTRCCPMLLELGAIAYWSLTASELPRSFRREIEEVTQCVISVADGRLRIAKAEGRPFAVQGSVFRCRFDDGAPVLEAAPAAARVGAALRAVRLQRHLSQSELARLAGISPSAVSQAERGQRGLSLETLLDLTTRLNITLDELLRGEVSAGYRLARRHDPHRTAEGKPLPLFDDPQAGIRTYLVRLAPRGTCELGFAHKGVEMVAVASGLVQVVLATGRPVLRRGEALLAERSGISSCRNLSDREAMLFWVLRDELGTRHEAPRA